MLGPADIALCVPCFNEADQIQALSASLARLEPGPGALFGLDDGSSDGTAAALEAGGLRCIRHEGNQGLGAARNRLWRAAAESGFGAVAFLDADVLPPADYIQRVASLFDTTGADGVGGRNEDPSDGPWVDGWRARYWPQGLGEHPLEQAPMLVGACASYRIEALDAVGGFDRDFRSHGEDVDIGRRLSLAGFRLHYAPDLVVRHQRQDSVATLLRGCFLHCREGMRAAQKTPGCGPRAGELVLGMGRKALWAPSASLLKRGDPREASLGALACSAGLLGYAVGWARPRRGRQ